jgi:hypothetical protein
VTANVPSGNNLSPRPNSLFPGSCVGQPTVGQRQTLKSVVGQAAKFPCPSGTSAVTALSRPLAYFSSVPLPDLRNGTLLMRSYQVESLFQSKMNKLISLRPLKAIGSGENASRASHRPSRQSSAPGRTRTSSAAQAYARSSCRRSQPPLSARPRWRPRPRACG